MANELHLGMRRVGDLIDFNPDTPPVKVALEHSDRGVGVTLSWSTEDNPYASWFLRDDGFVRIPPRPKAPPAPKRVLFRDSHGSVLLVGCRARGFHSNVGGPGSGTMWARAAIMGVQGEIDFDNPHGLQTEIGGLRAWLRRTSWEETRRYEERVQEVTVKSLNLPELKVGEYEGLRLSIAFGWGVQQEGDGDRRILTDIARCSTRTDTPTSWSTHLKLHYAVRDLLILSRWQETLCKEVRALRLDDPLRTLDGVEHGEQWRGVVIPAKEESIPPRGHRAHLVEYDDLGTNGLLRWIELRDEFARAIDPVVSSIGLRGATANTLLAQTGPGLEALGYLLMVRDGTSKKAATATTLKKRFERILADLGDSLPFNGASWVDAAAAAYNGLKHANRREPDPVDVVNAWRECVLVTRAWVAIELGVPVDRVRERLAMDPQRHAYVKVD